MKEIGLIESLQLLFGVFTFVMLIKIERKGKGPKIVFQTCEVFPKTAKHFSGEKDGEAIPSNWLEKIVNNECRQSVSFVYVDKKQYLMINLTTEKTTNDNIRLTTDFANITIENIGGFAKKTELVEVYSKLKENSFIPIRGHGIARNLPSGEAIAFPLAYARELNDHVSFNFVELERLKAEGVERVELFSDGEMAKRLINFDYSTYLYKVTDSENHVQYIKYKFVKGKDGIESSDKTFLFGHIRTRKYRNG